MTDHHPNARPRQARLYRNARDGWIRGVCAGLGDYFGVHVAWFRWGFVFGLFFFFLPTAIGYAIACFVLPEAPDHLYDNEEEAHFWRGVRTDPDRTFSGLRHRFRELDKRLRGLETVVTSREFRLRREIDGL